MKKDSTHISNWAQNFPPALKILAPDLYTCPSSILVIGLTDLQQFNTTTRLSVMGVSVVVKSARQDPLEISKVGLYRIFLF